jgi:CPA1 family monovalent cation:H+ antiporter
LCSCFSIIVQGLTIAKVANPKQIVKEEEEQENVALEEKA